MVVGGHIGGNRFIAPMNAFVCFAVDEQPRLALTERVSEEEREQHKTPKQEA